MVVALLALAVSTERGQAELEDLLPVLAAPQTAGDRVPEGVDLATLGALEPDSVRRVEGRDSDAQYWVGTTASNEVCLILHLPENDGATASSCAPVSSFDERGVPIRVSGTGGSAEAYLLPADVDTSTLPPALIEVTGPAGAVGATLVSPRPGAAGSLQPTQLERRGGDSFAFVPLR
ncbi:hypothetical protein [Aeromicrobium phragmitis]|uniref:hypothetical protein n=1 Tax=Aeromicrobium phragmitis TaxID=2478914 RepID=UPI00105FFC2A|nr:hypothetical protein [Aeromicrobium phragmitis]